MARKRNFDRKGILRSVIYKTNETNFLFLRAYSLYYNLTITYIFNAMVAGFIKANKKNMYETLSLEKNNKNNIKVMRAVNITVPDETYNQFMIIASLDGNSASGVLAEFIEKYVEDNKATTQKKIDTFFNVKKKKKDDTIE